MGHSHESHIIMYYDYFHFTVIQHSVTECCACIVQSGRPHSFNGNTLLLISSIKRSISIFQMVRRAHLKGRGHKIPYFTALSPADNHSTGFSQQSNMFCSTACGYSPTVIHDSCVFRGLHGSFLVSDCRSF